MNVPLAYFENNKCSYCNVISLALYHARTYPAATKKKWLINVYINYNPRANTCAYRY